MSELSPKKNVKLSPSATTAVPTTPANTAGQAVGCTNTDDKDKDFLSKGEIIKGLIIFFVGTGLGLVIFLLSYFGLSKFDIHYIVRACLSIAISIAILIALNAAMGSKKSKMQSPILMVLFIAFIFTILNGYEKQAPLNTNPDQPKQRFELVEIKESGKNYITKKSFSKGQQIKIVVAGNAYQTDCADWEKLLGEGEHSETMTGTGNMAFKADSAATVTIFY